MAFPMLDPSFMDMLATPPVDPFSLLESEQPSVLGVPFDENDVWQYMQASLDWLPSATIIDDDEWCPTAAMEFMNYEPALSLDTTTSHDDADTIGQVEEEEEQVLEDEEYHNWHDNDDDGSDYCPSNDEDEMDTVVPPDDDDDDDDSILDDDYHVPFLFKDGRSYAQEIVDIS